ncbi:MAG: general secretion pathway protein GspK [Candidatus Rokubacteria bacterium]|nr:general secretion pathway protein GspK [Candidatus Rokubacteria bacterium]
MTRDDRGFALVVVLLVLALVSVVGAEFAYSMRLEAAAVRAYKTGVIAGHLAETGVEQAIREIVADSTAVTEDDDGRLTFYDRNRAPRPRLPREKVEFGGGQYSYRVTDEGGRLNVNTATPGRVDRLLLALGVDKSARDTIVDSLQDWKDPNDEHRLNGAESEDTYLKRAVPYRAKNGHLDSVTELLQVKGVTPALFHGEKDRPGLAARVTTRSPNQVNMNTADPLVLRAFGLSDAEISEIVQARRAAPYAQVPGKFGGRSLSATTSTFRVEAEGLVDGRVGARVTAIVQKKAGNPPAIIVLEWSGLR